jgi:hypothetical protein
MNNTVRTATRRLAAISVAILLGAHCAMSFAADSSAPAAMPQWLHYPPVFTTSTNPTRVFNFV